MLLLFLFFGAGYGLGWIIRRLMAHFHKSMASCNIDKNGIRWRYFLSIVLVIFGFYFEIPLMVFFAGFTWYESQAKWCIVESFTGK